MTFFHNSPRDWSPRLARGLRAVRQLHDLFPKYMLQPYFTPGDWESVQWKIGRTMTLQTLRGDEEFLLAFVVTFEQAGPYARLDRDGIWITREGVIYVGSWIRRMLTEGLPLYPALAGRWPEGL